MDEPQLRRSICQAVGQLWLRGMIAGDGGMITAQLHRRRYLACPQGRRRADLQAADIICVDIGGQTVEGEGAIDIDQWLPHRLAYQCGLDFPEAISQAMPKETQRGNNNHDPQAISATVRANPTNVAALLQRGPQEQSLLLSDWPAVPIVNLDDPQAFMRALGGSPVVIGPGLGLLAVGQTVAQAINLAESIDHAAALKLLSRS